MKQAYLGAQRASRLVSQMMELSRMDASEVINESSVFIALDEMAQRFAKDMQATCATKGQSVVVEAEADVVVLVPLCDIESIFSNILDNAFKYGHPNSVIRMVVKSDQDQACLQVTNQGPLIAAQDKLQIFLPYFRNTEGAQNAISGSGLGLAIVKRIADRLNAQVSVRDEHGPEGTTFEVLFPSVV
jgi:signal transduction histidine kinase